MLTIAMVGYHNTLPFLYGLNRNKGAYNLILDYPSKCMDYYQNGIADVALVPVAALIDFSEYKPISNYCIGCVGEVETVCIYSNQEVTQLNKVYLDSDSRTSQLLTKILFKHHWYQSIEFEEVDARKVSSNNLATGEGILMIGDKAFGAESNYKFIYDLGYEWQTMTGLPFAFATWIARKDLHPSVVEKLNIDIGLGVNNIEQVLQENKELDAKFNLRAYFKKYIDYHYDANKRNAFALFKRLGKAIIG